MTAKQRFTVSPRRRRRLHLLSVLAIAALAVVLGGCLGLIYYGVVATNRITEVRETRLMHRAINRKLARLNDDITSAAIWNEAYDRTARGVDPAWAQINFGSYFHQY